MSLNPVKSAPIEQLLSFGLMKCMRETSQEHKLEPLRQKCVLPGIAQKHLSDTFKVLRVGTQQNELVHIVTPRNTGILWITR